MHKTPSRGGGGMKSTDPHARYQHSRVNLTDELKINTKLLALICMNMIIMGHLKCQPVIAHAF